MTAKERIPLETLKRYWPFLLLCVVGALLYGQTLNAPFYLDDDFVIAQNPLVRDIPLALENVLARRGLSILTFAVNYRLGGFVLAGYHLVNIVIHLLAACLVLLLLRRVFPGQGWLALFGALIFVAHPLQTQSVTYLVQRMTSLSALLFLLALYLFVRARECLAGGSGFRELRHILFYGGALLSGGLSILAKENAVVLPLALVLFSRLAHRNAECRWRPLLVYVAPFAVLPVVATIAYGVVLLAGGDGVNSMGYSRLLRSMEGNTPLHYLATQCSVLWVYIRMLFLPYGQALDHGYPVSRDLLTLKSVAGFAGLSILGVLACLLRHRQPVIACGIAWFFLTMAVESSLIPLDPLFEHRLYLPMFGFSMVVAALVGLLSHSSLRTAVAVMVVLSFAALTWQRNALWNNPIALYEQNLEVSPENERVYFNLGQEYIKSGRAEEGEYLLRRCISLNPSLQLGYRALMELYIEQNRLEDLVGMLHYAIDHVTPKGSFYNDLAFAYSKMGDFDSAIEMLHRAIAENPDVAEPYFNLAQMLMFKGDLAEVEVNLRKALAIDGNHVQARSMMNRLQSGKRPNSGSSTNGRP